MNILKSIIKALSSILLISFLLLGIFTVIITLFYHSGYEDDDCYTPKFNIDDLNY